MVAGRRILVVDDEPMVTSSCRRILGEEGDEVVTADSGRDGLQRALSERFDVVMTDLRMPDLDGMELVRTLKRRRPQTALVVLTGYGTVASAVEAAKLGVVDYIEKPFTPEQIRQAVSHALPSEAEAETETSRIDADAVRDVLRQAATDHRFARRLLYEGSRVLSGLALSPRAKASIASGDIAWIEAECGELSAAEREWLDRRLQAEIW